MQVMLNIPDEIPQEMVNKLLMQFEKQIQSAKKLIIKSSLKASLSEDEIKIKAGQDLAQMVYKLRESAAEIGFVSEEEIVALVKEVRAELYEREKQEDAQRWANYQLTGEAIGQVEMFAWMDNLSKVY